MSLTSKFCKKTEHREGIHYHKSGTNHACGCFPCSIKAKLLRMYNVKKISDELPIYLELSQIKHRCPACGTSTDRVYDYHLRCIKDIPLGRATL